jgi:oxepin-CoA hydrolase/3-oxo-5,6-dehydrosuberyl-CoA semialdehyde dehydrogenase
VEPAPGPVLANYGLENLRFITPVAAGDSMRVTITAKRITPRVTDEYGEVAWDAIIHNQDGEIVATYDVLTLVEKEDVTYRDWPPGLAPSGMVFGEGAVFRISPGGAAPRRTG